MQARVLGGIELLDDGTGIPLGGPKPRVLLAVLLAHRGRVVSSDLLADAMWGDDPPATARSTLQTHLSKLRRLVAPFPGVTLANRPPGYVLEVDPDVVDADRFEAGVAGARALAACDPQAAARRLDDALEEWRGPAFAEFADEPWARPEAVRLAELRLVAREERAQARIDAGEHAATIGELEALTAEHPLRERPWGQLMIALHRSGRQAEALRAAHLLRRHLGEELGLEPSPEICRLERAIAADDPSLRPPDRAVAPPPVSHAAPTPARVPGAATELIGRTEDLDRLTEVLGATRVLTLTGPGGVGKSRLAFELARRHAEDYADGTHVVELAPVGDPTEVTAAVAAALDVEQRPGRSLEESLVEVLAPAEQLLVLDNCEHVIGAVGELVVRLVRWCPGVRILATSREPVGMPGEEVWPVRPLSVPPRADAGFDKIVASPSVQVFSDRARQASPGFDLTATNAAAVAELCIRLDGVPLALELAAARMASMSPRQLADRLDERFGLLASRHALDPRHRTLLDLVQWSYELLSEDEQLLFDRLSVFAGGFDLEAAEATCADEPIDRGSVAQLVAALVDKSLVVPERHDDLVRFRQLETLRQYGADRLGGRPEATTIRRAHLATFVAVAERAEIALDTDREAEAVVELDREVDNLRAALRTAVTEHDADSALRLVTAAREFAFRRIRYELIGWAETATALPGAGDHPLLPTALAVVGYGSFVRGELQQAIEWGDRSVAAAERLAAPSEGLAERVLANAWFYLGEQDAALGWMERMREAAETSGRDGRIAHGYYMSSVARTSVGDAEGGERLAARSAEAAAGAGSGTARAQASYAAGLARAASGAPDADAEALTLLEASAEHAAQAGNRWMRAFALTESLWLRARRGETDAALAGYREVVETWFRGGDWANQWLSLRQLAGILASVRQDGEAALLFGAVAAAGATAALPFAPSDADEVNEVFADLDRRLGPAAMAEARRRGASMRDEAVVATALAAIDHLLG